MTGPSPNPAPQGTRRAAWVLFAVSVALLLALTLLPQRSRRDVNLVPLAQSSRLVRTVMGSPDPLHHQAFRYLVIQIGGNVVAFIPIGLSLAVLLEREGRRRTFIRALAASSLLSLGIELAQLALPTRATDVDDFIFNTFGAALGAGALLFLPRGRRQPNADAGGPIA